MPTVELRFTALPEHVRTARLVATSVARRLGMADEAVEGVRLAVGEACSRAVQRTESLRKPGAVHVQLVDDGGDLVVEVRDEASGPGEPVGDLSLPLVEGLADHVALGAGPGGAGGCLRMEWRQR